jgi:ABC-2 type transport system permease protein
VVVLPVLLMVAGQVTGVVLFDWSVVMVVGLVLAVVNLFLLGQVLRRLDRNRLFASQIK